MVPVPRFFGRCQAGDRVMRRRRPATVSSSTTRGTRVGAGVVAAQAVLLAGSRDVAVQGEADGVEQARLAGPGGSVHEEEPGRRDGVEVEGDPAGEGTEGLDLEAVDPHAAPVAAVRS